MGDSLVNNNGSSPPIDLKPVLSLPESHWGKSISYLQSYLQTEISHQHADIPIIACSLVSGLCDSSVYNAWSCFVSMQTGNTVFLALGASGQPISRPYGWLKSFTSILSFLLGCFCFAQTRRIDPLHRGTLTISFIIQGLFILVAAALVEGGVAPRPHGLETETGSTVSFIELVPLAFLAFQSGGQIVTSRLLGFNEVPTTVLTSVYCDLISDPKLLDPPKKNVKRNRRAAAIVTFLIGGIAGGWLTRSEAGLASALWIAGAIKVTIAATWLTWKAKKVTEA